MDTEDGQPSRTMRVVKSKLSWSTLILVAIGALIFIRVSSEINTIEYVLSPPKLPKYIDYEHVVYVNPIGSLNENSDWFHHASQGTATIPLPYNWLVSLEEPDSHPFWIFFGKNGLFKDDYMLRLGFIKQAATPENPDALPIGFAKTSSIYFAGIDRKADAAGFTCAACHTGQITYDDKRFIVDGGPAMTDLGLFTTSLGVAFGQTVLSSRFSIFNGRFERFAKRVLGSNYNPITKRKLKGELTKTLNELARTADTIDVTEGFTRLDALNRIGNQVFSNDMAVSGNYASIDAPVNYPQIWTTSWFNWVQYDGSIMQPLIRNTGEALGVKAFLDTKGPTKQRYASSVDINNLARIESWLGGEHPGENGNKFSGLLAPKWPADFPEIDLALAREGADLYRSLCQGCHLPPVDSEGFWSDQHWQKIGYVQGSKRLETKETYLTLNIIPVNEIGTDPAQSRVLANRTVNTTGLEINTEVCTVVSEDKNAGRKALGYVPMKDSATSNFGLALGAVVARTNQQWMNQNFIPQAERPKLEGLRPNCLQADAGYKARPLDGVWATAPFLHNGSIATIYDLLSTQDQRATFVQLGNQAFDPKKLGIVQSSLGKSYQNDLEHSTYSSTPDYSDDGLFVLDTRQPGNFNTGHLFDDQTADNLLKGRIGRKLSEKEKYALLEYLKGL